MFSFGLLEYDVLLLRGKSVVRISKQGCHLMRLNPSGACSSFHRLVGASILGVW